MFVSHIWRLHESTNGCNKHIFVRVKSWEFVLVSCAEICIGILCWDCTGAYLSKQSNGDLVWDIHCTKLPLSQLITRQNLLLFWKCSRFQHVVVASILLFFDSCSHCKLIFYKIHRMEAHLNFKHETSMSSWGISAKNLLYFAITNYIDTGGHQWVRMVRQIIVLIEISKMFWILVSRDVLHWSIM